MAHLAGRHTVGRPSPRPGPINRLTGSSVLLLSFLVGQLYFTFTTLDAYRITTTECGGYHL